MLIDITVIGKIISNNTKNWYNKNTRRIISYKPKPIVDYKQKIQNELEKYMTTHNVLPTFDPVILYLSLYFKIPVSYSKKKREALLYGYDENHAPAKVKPDLDNCLKLIIDAISNDKWHKGAYLLENDNQVCSINASKFYADDYYIKLRIDKWENNFEK